MKILLLTKYNYSGASSRYRTLQYLSYLKRFGIDVKVSCLLDDQHIQNRYVGKKISIYYYLKKYLQRIGVVLAQRKKFDGFWIEGELFPYLPFFLEKFFLPKNYIVEYDDAIFHNYDSHRYRIVQYLLGSKISHIMQYSKHVIVGNKYVQEYAIKVKAPRVTILPTVVDANVYTPSGSKQNSNKPVIIGWLGSPTTVKYLSLIEAVLARVAKQASIKLMIIGGKYPLIPEVNMVCYHWPNQWSEKEEVTWLNQIDIGVMPLTDSPWEKGKCGFKLIKYMGCAKPVVASPVSSNNDIVTHGVTGYLASTEKEWEEHLLTLIYDMERSIQFGTAGRSKMLEKYSLQSTAPILHRILLDEFK